MAPQSKVAHLRETPQILSYNCWQTYISRENSERTSSYVVFFYLGEKKTPSFTYDLVG